MSKRVKICDGKEFSLGSSFIHVPVHIDGLPTYIQEYGTKLQRKSEFHVSLFNVQKVILNNDISKDNCIKTFCDFVNVNEVVLSHYIHEFRYVRKEERETLVVMCEMTNLTRFPNYFKKKTGIEIDTQPTHVTLFTLGEDKGIGIDSCKELNEISEKVQVPDEVSLCFK